MKRRRAIAKAKTYGFSPWVDQVDSINQIMKETGERTESALLRQLVDEALEERRKKRSLAYVIEESDNKFDGRLEVIEGLLMRIVRHGETSLRILDLCLALIQDAYGEAYATHKLAWNSLEIPQLRAQGVDAKQFEDRFALRRAQAKDYAYGEARRLKKSQRPDK